MVRRHSRLPDDGPVFISDVSVWWKCQGRSCWLLVSVRLALSLG